MLGGASFVRLGVSKPHILVVFLRNVYEQVAAADRWILNLIFTNLSIEEEIFLVWDLVGEEVI